MFQKQKIAISIFLVLALTVLGVGTALAAVGTDQADYTPGSVVTIYGDNSDDAGYLPGEAVHVDVSGPNDYAASCDANLITMGIRIDQLRLATRKNKLRPFATCVETFPETHLLIM